MTLKSYRVDCALDGCTVRIGRGKLFCKDHYYALPRGLRDRLWAAWREAMKIWNCQMNQEEQQAVEREYQEAYQACCEHLRTAPINPAVAISTAAIAADGSSLRFVEGRQL